MRKLASAITAAALLAPATAMAVNYPAPSDPGKPGKRPAHTKTLRVCKRGKHCYHKIQKAVNAAKKGDTIKIGRGVYHEGIFITGRKKDWLRLIGDKKHPRRVIIDLKGVKGLGAQNGVIINGAQNVELSGLYTRHYKGNGFFAVNTVGYDFNHLVAGWGGTYGLYAFNSKGGRMTDSEAFYNNDGGYYVGQTPPQTKPRRTFANNLVAWGNVIGWSGTNMRYTTITKSRFFDNGVGIVPNALDSEKFQPAEDNVIYGNDVFWNNFNYEKGAPFKIRKSATEFAYPPGTGIVLLGGRRNLVQNNRVDGNWLVGISVIKAINLSKPDNQDTIDNKVQGNELGRSGTDLNGYDMFYDGSGHGNCWEDNLQHSPNIPADDHTFAFSCPHPGANNFDSSQDSTAISWLLDPTGSHWVKHPHAARKGYRPLVIWNKKFKPGRAVGGP